MLLLKKFKKDIDKPILYEYNRSVTVLYAGVAQSVVQLIRNQQVACSSHVTSFKKAVQHKLSGSFLI